MTFTAQGVHLYGMMAMDTDHSEPVLLAWIITIVTAEHVEPDTENEPEVTLTTLDDDFWDPEHDEKDNDEDFMANLASMTSTFFDYHFIF